MIFHRRRPTVTGASEQFVVYGIAVPYERYSRPIQERSRTFQESIARNAFAGFLRTNPDIWASVGHDHERHLGSTRRGNLTIVDEREGLAFVLVIDRRTRESIGPLAGVSIGFNPTRSSSLGNFCTVTRAQIGYISLMESPMVPAYPGTWAEIVSEKQFLETLK